MEKSNNAAQAPVTRRSTRLSISSNQGGELNSTPQRKRKRRSQSLPSSPSPTKTSAKKKVRHESVPSTPPQAVNKPIEKVKLRTSSRRASTSSIVSNSSVGSGDFDQSYDSDASAIIDDELEEGEIEELSDEGYESARDSLELTQDKYVKILNTIKEELEKELLEEVDGERRNEINKKIEDIEESIRNLEENGNFTGNWINLLERRVDFTISLRDWMEKKREEGVDIFPHVPELIMRVVAEICKTVNKNYDPTKDEESGKGLRSVWQAKRLIHYFKDLSELMTVEQRQIMTKLIIRTDSKYLTQELLQFGVIKSHMFTAYSLNKDLVVLDLYEAFQYSIQSEKVVSAEEIARKLFGYGHVVYNGSHLLSDKSISMKRSKSISSESYNKNTNAMSNIWLSVIGAKGFDYIVQLMLIGDVLHLLRSQLSKVKDIESKSDEYKEFRERLDNVTDIIKLELNEITKNITYDSNKKVKNQGKINLPQTIEETLTPYFTGKLIAELFFNHKSDISKFIAGSYKDRENPDYSSLNNRYKNKENIFSSLSLSSHLSPSPIFTKLCKSIASKKHNLNAIKELLCCMCKKLMEKLLQKNGNIVADEEVGKILEFFGVDKKYIKISPKEQDMGNDNSSPSNNSTSIQHEFKNELGALLVINKANNLSKGDLSKLRHKLKKNEVLTLPDEQGVLNKLCQTKK